MCNDNQNKTFHEILNILKRAINKINISFIRSRSWSQLNSPCTSSSSGSSKKEECQRAIEAALAVLSFNMNTRDLKRSKSLPSFPISIRREMSDNFAIADRITGIDVENIVNQFESPSPKNSIKDNNNASPP